MDRNISEKLDHCHARARRCADEAKVTTDPKIQRQLLMLEQAWIKVAEGMEAAALIVSALSAERG
jgi:hypothetical protein